MVNKIADIDQNQMLLKMLKMKNKINVVNLMEDSTLETENEEWKMAKERKRKKKENGKSKVQNEKLMFQKGLEIYVYINRLVKVIDYIDLMYFFGHFEHFNCFRNRFENMKHV